MLLPFSQKASNFFYDAVKNIIRCTVRQGTRYAIWLDVIPRAQVTIGYKTPCTQQSPGAPAPQLLPTRLVRVSKDELVLEGTKL